MWPRVKATLIIALCAAPVIALLASEVLDRRGSRELAEAEARARALGIPIDYKDPYYTRWTLGSMGENGAFYYETAFTLLASDKGADAMPALPLIGRKGDVDPDPRKPLPPDRVEQMKAYLSDRANILTLLHQGAECPTCRFSVEWRGMGTLLPHLTRARQSARMVALQMWLYAEEGRPAEAIRLSGDAFALARPLFEEPATISALVGSAIDLITVGIAVRRVLARTEPMNEDLLVLQQRLMRAAGDVSLRAAARGEVAYVGDLYRRMAGGLPYRDDKELHKFTSDGPGRRAWLWLLRGSVQAERARVLHVMIGFAQKVENPAPDILAKSYYFTDWSPALEPLRYFPSIDEVPNLPSALRQHACTRAKLMSAAACVAAMRYKNDKGKWPTTLDDLVPSYIDTVPTDPFTGKALIYRQREGGIVVYSVGLNGTDDGGSGSDLSLGEHYDEAHDDVGFRVWK